MTEKDIQHLISRVQQGETDQFGQIFELFSDKIFRHISFRVGGDREIAKDLTSEVFLGAWQSLPRYRPQEGAKFSTWLFSIARRTLADYYRRHQRRERGRVGLDEIEDLLPDLSPSPEEQAGREVAKDQVLAAIQQLPPDLAEAVTLHYIDEMEYEEMSEIMGKTTGHLRVLVHRGLERLRKELNHD